MARSVGSFMAGTAGRETLSPPGLVPTAVMDPEENVALPAQYGADGTRTSQVPFAPLSETRVMIADRTHALYQPGPSYANVDPQRGGAPGSPGADPSHPSAAESYITSQSPSGVTSIGTAPSSPIKRSFGLADWADEVPTFKQAHLAINRNANPNRPQVNPTPFNTEGPQQNTQYSTPTPWAAGVYIG